ncbi:IS4 family transposase [Sphaerotilus montanus]|uniref:Transposase n=3 Tax=Sphaerotilus montanus TaxID=522889 RepID=A0A7Y9R488_9BURK|nr:IS4 family transposase [Sphaerotilus montanus]NYG33070.1 hypothetical protein [Sphaerotilus montanus]NYG34970.1 hypothetical protein [Sphaerotilus montanus]
MQSMTRLQALLKPLAKSDVDRLAREHGAQRYGKGALTVWDQLLVMLHGQFVQAPSLRGALQSFNAHKARLAALQTHELRRSTLSDGNRRAGSATVLSQVLQGLIRQLDGCRDKRVLGATSLIDSTPLTLKGRGFDVWTLGTKTRRTQGVKVHVQCDAATHAISRCEISAPNVNDVVQARQWEIQPGTTCVFDRAYCDYAWWARMIRQGVKFVTRLKRNAGMVVLEALPVPETARGRILDDERIARRWRHPRSGKTWREPLVLRRIRLRTDDARLLVLVTNDFERTAIEIGDLYRSRWQIELLFKWIKQHLAIRRTWGTNEHAAHLQIYAAFIAHVLLMLHQQASRSTTDLWVLLQRWRYGLFEPCEQALMPVCVPP